MIKNNIRDTIVDKQQGVLNVYFTAGYPQLHSTVDIIKALDASGADLIELGMPYSDPLADGLTIQKSSEKALANGLNLKVLFDQIEEARKSSDIPIIMMGYYNQLIQYGVEKFIKQAASIGVDGMIIPDLPMNEYERKYKSLFESNNISMSFLITPMTSEERIHQADRLSSGFIYMVSQSSITGKTGDISIEQHEYFRRINEMGLQSPRLIGFGIHDHQTFSSACQNANGAIIGSAYIRALENSKNVAETTAHFIKSIKNPQS